MQKIAGLARHLLGAAIGRRAGSQHGNKLSPGCATWHASNALQSHGGRRQAALQLRSHIMGAQQLRLPARRHLCRSRQSCLLIAATKCWVHPFKGFLNPLGWAPQWSSVNRHLACDTQDSRRMDVCHKALFVRNCQALVWHSSIECWGCAQSNPHLPFVEAARCQHKEAEVLRCGRCGHMQAKHRLRRGRWP